MCHACGCDRYVGKGKQVALDRAVEIVKELGLTAQNVDDYEATEMISDLIAPFGSQTDEVCQTAVWVADLHMSMPRLKRQERYEAHVRAFRDIFSRLPSQGDWKRIAATFHQLEQLVREIDETDLASQDPQTRDALQAVKHVHDNLLVKIAKLKQRYSL